MRKTIYLFLMATIAILSGCSDDNGSPDVLKITAASTEIPATGGSGEIHIQASGDVNATSGKSWLNIDLSGVTSTVVSFTVEPNDGITSRIAEISITSGNHTEKIHIIQAGARFEIDADEIQLAPFAQKTYVEFISTIEPQIEVSESWLEVTAEEGRLVLLPQINLTGTRSATVKLRTPWKSASFTVSQRTVSLNGDEVLLHRNGKQSTDSIGFSEYSDEFNGLWQTSTNESWIAVRSNNGQVIITADENTTGGLRTGYVEVSIGGNLFKTIEVKQVAFSYEFFLGEWELAYNSTQTNPATLTFTLSERVYGANYHASGLVFSSNNAFRPNVKIDFNPETGDLALLYQNLGMYSSNYVYLCPWVVPSGNISHTSGSGFNLVYNHDDTSPEFEFANNGFVPGLIFNSIYVGAYSQEGQLVGYVHRIYYPTLMRRKTN